MITYEAFKERHYPTKKQWSTFAPEELTSLAGKLPDDIIEFLRKEGVSSYSNHFLWTTHPSEFTEVMSCWGLDGPNCHVFIRTAFGGCIYYQNRKFFYLDTLEGRIGALGVNSYVLLNVYLILNGILTGGLFEDYFQNLEVDPGLLDPQKIFAFIPSLPIGGSFLTSRVEAVQMKEHLFYLAQLFEGKITMLDAPE